MAFPDPRRPRAQGLSSLRARAACLAARFFPGDVEALSETISQRFGATRLWQRGCLPGRWGLFARPRREYFIRPPRRKPDGPAVGSDIIESHRPRPAHPVNVKSGKKLERALF